MAESTHPPDADALPVRRAPRRTEFRVRPTDDRLAPDGVATQFRTLHRLGRPPRGGSLLRRLFVRSSSPPTVECRLVSPGGEDAALSYSFGVDDPDLGPPLERWLRGLLPDSYELEPVARPTDPFEALPGADVDDGTVAAVEYRGRAERRRDWQARLAPFAAFLRDEHARVPLAAVVETMAASPVPMVYQALFRPLPDWTRRATDRRIAIEAGHDTLGGQLTNAVFGAPEDGADVLAADDERRLAELAERDARRSFAVNARVVAVGPEGADWPERAARALASAFADVGRSSHGVEGVVSTGDGARAVLESVRSSTFSPPRYERPASHLPWTANTSPGIVADAAEAPSFGLLGGRTIDAAGARAMSPTPGERTALPRPPFEQLASYRGPGLTIGHPLTQDGTPDDAPIALPPDLQSLHAAWFGKTGSGKTTSVINAVLDNHAATDGCDVLIDPKGDGMATDYLRAHYARFGTLDDVVYFDCAEVLPAFSFFDVRDELAAGVPRTTAVEDRVDHYVEVLMQVMGRDRFEQAVRSPDVIRYLVKALFDPVNGADAYSHRELHDTIRVMHERQAAPAVSDPDLESALAGVVANRAQTFDDIMGGVLTRVEKITGDQRLSRIFNHVPGEGDPHLDLAEWLDEHKVVIVDTGGLRTEAQRVVALGTLSNLWTALRRRKRREPDRDHPLVNVYIEEAASVANSELLKELLAHSRGFDCSVTLSMQFPAQLRGFDQDVYDEVLNNVSTVVTGNVPSDARLAKRLATDDMDAEAVGNRLRALRRGQWLVRLPAAFDAPEPRPFLVGSLPPPPGDEAGPRPLSADAQRAFEGALDDVRERTLAEVALTMAEPEGTQSDHEDAEPELPETRVDSALPYTRRLTWCVDYDREAHALLCLSCDARYDASIDGLKRAIECHSSLDEVDRDDVPICDVNLKLTPAERAASERSDRQLLFLQAVYSASQLRYDPLEYDIVWDSMLRLQEYVGIETAEVQDLIDAGLLRLDTEHPHKLYSVTPEGRRAIGEHYREGVDYGHGKGDLEESSEHVFGVEVGRRWALQAFVEDSESAVHEIVPYYEIGENRRLDIAGLDADGNVILAVEVERINHDALRAIPDDYDKMADCDVDEAIWIVMTRDGGHAVLDALRDPPDGRPRIQKEYSPNTPPHQFTIETPGLTAVYTARHLRGRLDRD